MPYDFSQQVLRTDAAGMPLDWVSYKEAARCYCLGQVLYSCGNLLYRVRGGSSAITGRQSVMEISSIIATVGDNQSKFHHQPSYAPPLSNKTLFSRDDMVCMYCGKDFLRSDLSRDHVTPVSQGGRDVWTNLVTACKRCNNFKAGSTPEQAGMQLLAVPFTPTHAEYVFLRGRRVLADQMEFLKAHFPRTSPLRVRVEEKQDRSAQEIFNLGVSNAPAY
ncbi:MAG: 5-methylcytosine-specific restriction endonuclease McrA [Cryomorphaceae bacterium]